MSPQDVPYLRFVRSLACISCAAPPPSEASHVATGAGQKGIGLKVPDSQAVPQCHRCHAELDGRNHPGRFDHLDRDARRELAALWVEATQAQTIPGDDFDAAMELAEIGIGRIEVHDDGTWAWIEMWQDNQTKEPSE